MMYHKDSISRIVIECQLEIKAIFNSCGQQGNNETNMHTHTKLLNSPQSFLLKDLDKNLLHRKMQMTSHIKMWAEKNLSGIDHIKEEFNTFFSG